MKKIVSAAVAATLLAGAAFADVKVGFNGRMQNIKLYEQSKTADGSKTTTSLNLGTGSDSLTFKASDSYGGVSGELTVGTNTSGNATIAGSKYWAWLTWGKFNLTGGNFDSRWSTRLNGAATEINTVDSSTSKYGISGLIAGKALGTTTLKWTQTSGTAAALTSPTSLTAAGLKRADFDELDDIDVGSAIGKFGVDFDDVSAIGGTRVTSLFGDYTISDVLPGSLLLKAGLITSAFKTDTDDEENLKYIKAGFMGEIGYNQADAIKADLVVTVPTEKQFGIGAYFQPLMLPENLKLTAGFTFISSSDDSTTYKFTDGAAAVTETYKWTVDEDGNLVAAVNKAKADATKPVLTETITNKYTAWAADLQAQFKVNDQLNTILQAKYTQLKFKGDGIDALKDAADIDLSSWAALEIAAEVAYKVNDLLTVALDGALYMNDLNNTDKSKEGQNTFVVLPNLALTAGKNARLCAGFKYTQALDIDEDDNADAVKTSMSVPVVLRIKF